MSTSHPPNAYTSSYHHQLASQPHHQPPQPSYQHPSHPGTNHHPQGPVQIVRSGSRDSASSDQPSPQRDGRDPYGNRERRDPWPDRVERKTRPATIAELAEKSREDLWDPNKHLKHWLRTAELARKSGKQYAENGDYERSFIQLARAATIILEKMPTHRDYNTLLTSNQRNNLVLHGQETLDNLAKLKPGLLDRYEKWAAKYPEHTNDFSYIPTVLLEPATLIPPAQGMGPTHVSQPTTRDSGEGQYLSRNQSYTQEDPSNVDSISRRDRDRDRERDRERERSREPPRDYYSQPSRDSPTRSNEEARRAAEEAIRRRTDQIRNPGRVYSSSAQHTVEHVGIAQRQQEAEAAAQAARREIAASHAPPNPNMNGVPPVMPVLPAPISASSHQNPGYPPHPGQSQPPPPPPPPMQIPQSYQSTSSSASMTNPGSAPQPQKSPAVPYNPYNTSSSSTGVAINPPTTRGSTEADSQKQNGDSVVIPPPPASFPGPISYSTQHAVSHDPLVSTKLTNRYPYPSPVTTTSPFPGPVRYPTLMSQHQMKQGYVPSLHSMFQGAPQDNAPISSSSLLLQDGPGSGPASLGLGGVGGLYNNPFPQPSAPISGYEQQAQRRPSQIPPPPGPGSSINAVDQTRITPAASGDVVPRDLKTVYLPRESLPRFLNVAAVNTARNRETCGLLLGRDRKSRFVVTTLLIPKQHSTSDTCTMDEEELVMGFTEERSLITLGWIHTHPTQSCFMSSVDLHTHSGFQRMLPESFAVVCAPTSTPNFGIFRLTDPPGLQAILDCTQKEAFHPHPPVPIYTDADKGHVQIKDSLTLEIVDLRDE